MQDIADLKRLKLFRQVVACGGLSPAETILDINLPTISAHLAALEKSLGVRLCERGRQGFRLTADGQRVLDASDRLFESMALFQSEIGDVSQVVSGNLRLGVVDNTITDPRCRVVRALQALRSRSRDLEINIDIRNPSELERAILDERLDIAIGPFHTTNPGIEQHALHAERISLYLGAGHALFERPSIALEDLAGADYVMRGYLRESQRVPQHVSFNSCAVAHNIEGVATLVLTGRYLGYLPEHYAESWVQQGRMRRVLPEAFSHDVAFKILVLKGKRRSRVVEALVEELLSAHQADGAVA